MDSLFSVHTLATADSSSTDQADSAEAKDSTEVKPTLLWGALYMYRIWVRCDFLVNCTNL